MMMLRDDSSTFDASSRIRVGDHAEAAPGLAGALGLDRGVERHQPRLQRDLE